MVERYVMSIDQGTMSTRCILFDRQGRLVSVAQREHEQHYAKPGWAEHDPTEIWSHLRRVVVPRALEGAGIEPDRIAAIGIANQRETTAVWDRRTGVPVSHAITWQDTRTSGYVEQLRPTTGDGVPKSAQRSRTPHSDPEDRTEARGGIESGGDV